MKKPLFISLIIVFVMLWTSGLSYTSEKANSKSRPPAVAGMFYPDSPKELRKKVRAFLDNVSGTKIQGKIRGLVSPHAGYIYSGVVAAAGYKRIDPSIERVILLGPSHRAPLNGASIPEVKSYQTPLGNVALDEPASILRKSSFFHSVAKAHEKEHSLEVQLPFLQVILKDFKIVPILTNNADPEALAVILAPHVNSKTLVVASSDLSHYYSYETAVSLDRICTRAITDFNFSDMAMCEACGKQAVLTLMHIAKIKGWQSILIDYKNSGDTAGSKNRVVGYTSIAFVERKETSAKMKRDHLPVQDKKGLLKLARSAIESRLVKGAKVVRPQACSSALLEDRGCFVTLHKNGQLRGCIGSIEPVSPLVECIEEHAKSAAFRDPRFPPLTAEELPEIDIEVSVLTVPKKLSFKDGEDLKDQLEPLVHGVILSRGFKKSTFLPQVWKQLPDKEAFLEHLCVKGGMSRNGWQDPKTEVRVYEAEVFGEKE